MQEGVARRHDDKSTGKYSSVGMSIRCDEDQGRAYEGMQVVRGHYILVLGWRRGGKNIRSTPVSDISEGYILVDPKLTP